MNISRQNEIVNLTLPIGGNEVSGEFIVDSAEFIRPMNGLQELNVSLRSCGDISTSTTKPVPSPPPLPPNELMAGTEIDWRIPLSVLGVLAWAVFWSLVAIFVP